MDYPGNGNPSYEVYCSGAVAKTVREVYEQASRQGRGKEMVSAFHQAFQRLRQNPHSFGEPLYRLPILRMLVCAAVIRPIAIDFAICTDRPMVFIKNVTLLSQ
jgi:hypothetical protein